MTEFEGSGARVSEFEKTLMSSQAEVHSIEALKDFRAVLALYSDDTLAALGAVDAELRRTTQWLQQDRPVYWQEQIKRRREQVAAAKSEVFRRKLQKKPDYSPSMSEPLEALRRAEASLQDAEKRFALVRKWQPLFHQSVLEYHGSTQRLKDLAAADVPRALNVLSRIVDALEAYLSVAPAVTSGQAAPQSAPSSQAAATTAPRPAPVEFETIVTDLLDAEPPAHVADGCSADAFSAEPFPSGAVERDELGEMS
jgi:hypothetical protein